VSADRCLTTLAILFLAMPAGSVEHRDGIFPFYCTMHQPAMSGQIIVLPPKSGG